MSGDQKYKTWSFKTSLPPNTHSVTPSTLSVASGLPSSLPGVLAGCGGTAVCPSAPEGCETPPGVAEGVTVGVTDGGVAATGPSALTSLPTSSDGSSCVGVTGDNVLGSEDGVESVCVLCVGLG